MPEDPEGDALAAALAASRAAESQMVNAQQTVNRSTKIKATITTKTAVHASSMVDSAEASRLFNVSIPLTA